MACKGYTFLIGVLCMHIRIPSQFLVIYSPLLDLPYTNNFPKISHPSNQTSIVRCKLEGKRLDPNQPAKYKRAGVEMNTGHSSLSDFAI